MRRTNTLATVALTLLLALSLPAGIGLGAANSQDGSVTTIDADHPVASNDSVTEFSEDGVTSGDVGTLALNLTVAEKSEDVGVDSAFETDFNAVYLRADYDETIERSVRVYIPNEMWYPHRLEGEDPIKGSTEADFDTAQDGEYTAVTLHFKGKDDSVYRISKEAATIYEMRAKSSGLVENVTGYELPTVMASTDWEYPDDAFANNESTVAFEHGEDPLVLEYDSDETPGRERWADIPSCDSTLGSDAPVCTFERDGVANTTYVTDRSGDPPAIRYTDKRSMLDSFRSTVLNDLQNALEGVQESIGEYMPGTVVPVLEVNTIW